MKIIEAEPFVAFIVHPAGVAVYLGLSFPCSPLSRDSPDPAGWRLASKRRRMSRFWPASGRIMTRAPGIGRQPQPEAACDFPLGSD